jgi:PhnB protein
MAGQSPPDWSEKIFHLTFTMDDQVLAGADVPPDRYQKPQGFSVAINLADAAGADRIFQTLSENGEVQMPLQQTFWALRFGVLVDQFGTPWIINCENPA